MTETAGDQGRRQWKKDFKMCCKMKSRSWINIRLGRAEEWKLSTL